MLSHVDQSPLRGFRIVRLAALLTSLLAAGCAHQPKATSSEDAIFFVHGVGGAGAVYNDLLKSLSSSEAKHPPNVRVFRWGAPPLLFFLDFQNDGVHRSAERRLAADIRAWREKHPDGRIDVVGYSAGCGVTLGALALLKDERPVTTAVLLAPSVSPGYDLAPALAGLRGKLHTFRSTGDVSFLKWRTGTFGTYDNVRTPAAGHLGFSSIESLPATQRSRIIQHTYDAAWNELGHDGGHFGYLKGRWVQDVVVPLLSDAPPK